MNRSSFIYIQNMEKLECTLIFILDQVFLPACPFTCTPLPPSDWICWGTGSHYNIIFTHSAHGLTACHIVTLSGFFFLLRNGSLKHWPLSVPHPFSWRPPRPFWKIRAFSQPALMCGIIATPCILMAPQKAVWICPREHLQQNIIFLFLSILVHFHI